MVKPVILLILDGWGLRRSKKGNAIKLAKTPNLDTFWKQYPHAVLKASDVAVGLPQGYFGNSEVGHMTMGAGRIIDTDLLRIDKAIKDKSFFRNKVLLHAMKQVKKNNATLHLLGLLSDKGVHSHVNHLFALLQLAKKNKIKQIHVHAILDGRDTYPKSAKKYLNQLQKKIKQLRVPATIATIMGRFYGMDRDNRWNREHKAYDVLVNQKGKFATNKNAIKVVDDYYKQGITDEFVPPTLLQKVAIQPKDAVIFFNFRSDRARELTRAFVEGKFQKFKRKKLIDLYFACMTQYDKRIKVPVAFPPQHHKNIFAELVAKKKYKQLHIAETEKYAHVTYFFNVGREKPFPYETRILIPSPKVTTYDKKPEMSAYKITKRVLQEMSKKKFRFIVMNFANGDMVGHTGNLNAAKKAAEVVDDCIGRIVQAAQEYTVIITADHGNCEEELGKFQTSHTSNNIPFIILDQSLRLKKTGGLQDVAPTILQMLHIKKPGEMSGKSLLLY